VTAFHYVSGIRPYLGGAQKCVARLHAGCPRGDGGQRGASNVTKRRLDGTPPTALSRPRERGREAPDSQKSGNVGLSTVRSTPNPVHKQQRHRRRQQNVAAVTLVSRRPTDCSKRGARSGQARSRSRSFAPIRKDDARNSNIRRCPHRLSITGRYPE